MDLFEFVKASLPILDVVGEYVQIKPMGNYHKGSCPFHSEKDASFTVSPDKQIFYCFGCQASGDVIGFIAKIENMTQLEGAKHLIDRYGLQIPETVDQSSFKKISSVQKGTYYAVYQAATEWMHDQLLKSKPAMDYLEQRGLSGDQIKNFQVGYFPSGIRNLNRFAKAMAERGILLADLVEHHIVMEGSLLYSPFEERIIFPIADHIGRYCGFGGRVFKKEDERAKYYNSRESDFFSKGKLLFGLDKAKRAIQEKEEAFLVEGYMDCLAMVQHGYRNTVATLGTACTFDHLKLLARYCSVLYLLYDGDKAGQDAILRIAQLCWQVDLELKVVKLPVTLDPDSFLQQKGDLQALVQQSYDIFSFFIQGTAGDDFPSQPLSKKLSIARKIVELVVMIPDAFKRDLLLHQAASVMQMPFQSVKNYMIKNRQGFVKKAAFVEPERDAILAQECTKEQKEAEATPFLEEKIFSVILNSTSKAGALVFVDADLIPYFSSRIQILLKKLYALAEKSTDLSGFFAQYTNSLDQIDRQFVARISIENDAKNSSEELEKLILHFCRENWKYIARTIKQEIVQAKQEQNHEQLEKLFN
ncbi:MAG: DNA primase, partial [bacterium]